MTEQNHSGTPAQPTPDKKRLMDLAEEIEDSYQSSPFIQDIVLNEEERRMIVGALHALAAQPPAAPVETERKTFTIPPGYEAVRDSEGRATGEVRPRCSAGNGGEISAELRERIADAKAKATESAKVSLNSYGAGYDLGYHDALGEFLEYLTDRHGAYHEEYTDILESENRKLKAEINSLRDEPQTVRETDAYRDTVKKVAAVREKRLAELVEENAQLRAELAKKRPDTLPGMIADVYGELDAEDCTMVDREWARQRGYILPTNGTSQLSRPQEK